MAARSAGRRPDSRMRAWKEVPAGSPQQWKKPRFPNEGLEGGAPKHWKKPRIPNEGLKGGAGKATAWLHKHMTSGWLESANCCTALASHNT